MANTFDADLPTAFAEIADPEDPYPRSYPDSPELIAVEDSAADHWDWHAEVGIAEQKDSRKNPDRFSRDELTLLEQAHLETFAFRYPLWMNAVDIVDYCNQGIFPSDVGDKPESIEKIRLRQEVRRLRRKLRIMIIEGKKWGIAYKDPDKMLFSDEVSVAFVIKLRRAIDDYLLVLVSKRSDRLLQLRNKRADISASRTRGDDAREKWKRIRAAARRELGTDDAEKILQAAIRRNFLRTLGTIGQRQREIGDLPVAVRDFLGAVGGIPKPSAREDAPSSPGAEPRHAGDSADLFPEDFECAVDALFDKDGDVTATEADDPGIPFIEPDDELPPAAAQPEPEEPTAPALPVVSFARLGEPDDETSMPMPSAEHSTDRLPAPAPFFPMLTPEQPARADSTPAASRFRLTLPFPPPAAYPLPRPERPVDCDPGAVAAAPAAAGPFMPAAPATPASLLRSPDGHVLAPTAADVTEGGADAIVRDYLESQGRRIRRRKLGATATALALVAAIGGWIVKRFSEIDSTNPTRPAPALVTPRSNDEPVTAPLTSIPHSDVLAEAPQPAVQRQAAKAPAKAAPLTPAPVPAAPPAPRPSAPVAPATPVQPPARPAVLLPPQPTIFKADCFRQRTSDLRYLCENPRLVSGPAVEFPDEEESNAAVLAPSDWVKRKAGYAGILTDSGIVPGRVARGIDAFPYDSAPEVRRTIRFKIANTVGR